MKDEAMYAHMRRFVRVLQFVVLLFLLVACKAGPVPGQSRETPTSTPIVREETPTPTPSPTATPRPAPPRTVRPQPTPTPTRPGVPPSPVATGQVILVSLSQQWLYAYTDGQLVFDNAVETGRPELPTPTGTFSVLAKSRDITFTSPLPEGSPYYYGPTHINYALLFKEGGFFLHDAWWHVQFGPGSNVPHQLPNGQWETGSHGCIGMPIPHAKRLYEWAPAGTLVIIRN